MTRWYFDNLNNSLVVICTVGNIERFFDLYNKVNDRLLSTQEIMKLIQKQEEYQLVMLKTPIKLPKLKS